MAANVLSSEQIMEKVATGKPFILLLLQQGQATMVSEAEMGKLQMAHLKHLFTLETEGKVSIFGPVSNSEQLNGIIVFNSVNKEEVHQWMKDDPFIKAGLLTYQLFDWFTIPGMQIPQ